MRVLLTSIAHFCDVPGGSQRIVEDESKELQRRGHDVWVIAPGDPSLSPHEIRDGVNLLRYAAKNVAAWNPSRRSSHQEAATQLLRDYLPRVEAIHGHTPLSYLAACDFYGEEIHACYTIHSPAKLEMAIVWRNSGFLRRVLAPVSLAVINRIERQCIQRSRIVSALSQFTIDRVSVIHGGPLARTIRLLPGWVETSVYVPRDDRTQAKNTLGWSKEYPVFFTLRRLSPRMGLRQLLQASSILKQQGLKFHLMIGGNGPLSQELKDQSHALGLQETVRLLGRIENEQLPLAYAACDAFLLPTAELECFGLIALEALASGRPVLATPIGAIPEILTRVEPAWLTQSANPADIAELMKRYIRNELPQHSPWDLHRFADREYARSRLLPAYVDATVFASHG